jgi:hypothetical protein
MTAASAPASMPRAPSAPVLRRCACGGKGECAECRKKRTGLQRSASSTFAPGLAPPLVHDVLRSPGQPLDAATRASMEPRFGHSFADVRIHADGRAAESAAAVQADAYAVGRDVVFGTGKYAPASAEGRRLIAHELAHVVQQRGAVQGSATASLEIGAADAPEEREAEAAAGGAVTPSSAPLRVARAPARTTDDMHRGLRERWRAERHLPPEGRGEGGRAGPSDSELTYGGRIMGLPCPPPGGRFAELACLPGQYTADGPTCVMADEHRRLLGPARADATARLQRARRVLASRPEGPALAMDVARATFTGTTPTLAVITRTLGQMAAVLGGVEIVTASCDDAGCQAATVMAYVDGPGAGPLYICPRSWLGSQLHKLEWTILHEVAHLVGIDAARTTDELYCRREECGAPCADAGVVDAWAKYIHCLGQAPLRTGFDRRTVQDVEERFP